MGGHVARMGERRGAFRILVRKPEKTRPLEDSGLGVSVILRWIFGKWDVGAWTRLIWLRIGTVGGRL